MNYVYEFELFKGEHCWCAAPFDLPGATQGASIEDACESAADLLRETVRDRLLHGKRPPAASFGNELRQGGTRMIVSAEVRLDDIEKVSAAEAALRLGVSRSRITALLANDLLDGWREGRNTWVTVDSLEARLADPRAAGRPAAAQSLVTN